MSKYKKGELITNLNDFWEQDLIYFHDKIQNKGWFQNWQIRLVVNYIERGWVFKVKLRDDNKTKPYSERDYEDAKLRGLDLDNWNDYEVYYELGYEEG